jgi:hypothetical protein
MGARVETGLAAEAAVGEIGTNAVVGITFGVVIAIVAAILAVLALIISRRLRPIDSPSAQAFEEETTAVFAYDEELSDFVSDCGGGSGDDLWKSPSLDCEAGPENE